MERAMADNHIWKREEFKKVNQHYVPQFWQRRFKDAADVLYVRYSASADPRHELDPDRCKAFDTTTKKTLTGDCTYTVSDERFQPYDVLENLLAESEDKISRNETILLDHPTDVTTDVIGTFCWGMAIATCRLPYIMKRNFKRITELVSHYPDVHRMSRKAFEELMAPFGQTVHDKFYTDLFSQSEEQLVAWPARFAGRSPQDPVFAEQDALLGIGIMTHIFKTMDLLVLEITGAPYLIIGDTPIPDSELIHGFVVPLAKTAAVQFSPTSGSPPKYGRRAITAAEASAINQEQYNNSVTHVIGPDRLYLDSLKS
jgi:hypothetical protein